MVLTPHEAHHARPEVHVLLEPDAVAEPTYLEWVCRAVPMHPLEVWAFCAPTFWSINPSNTNGVYRFKSWPQVESHNEPLSPLKEFILPGGERSAALAHVARTVCRRAERAVVALSIDAASTPGAINPLTLKYLNRLSDYLFILARTLNRVAGRGDVLWQKGRNR